MAQTWIVPTANDLKKVIGHESSESANENTDAAANSESGFEPANANRANDLLAQAVVEFRQSVERGARYPLSVTSGSVAPEAVAHCLNWAAWRLIVAVPNLKFVIITDKGAYSPFQRLYEQACAYFKSIVDGGAVTLPTDPTGRDYLTAADEDDNPLPQGIRWGDYIADADEYAAGEVVDPVSGATIDLPQDMKI